MSSSLVEAYEFGPFRLEPAERRLLRDGQFVPLPPKALDLLIALVSRPGRLVTRETLLEEVWSGTFVEEANLSYTVSLLRKALDDGNGDARYIDTVPKRGYRFKADIRTVAADISGTERDLSSPEHFVETTETRAVDPPPSQTAKTSIVWSWRYAVLGLGVLGLAALSLMAILQRTPDGPGPLTSPARFDVTLPEPIQLPLFGSPVISPDGTRVAFVNRHNRQLWIRRLDSATAQAVSGTEGAISPFWSPDSRSIGFFADGKLKRVDVVGGPVLTLCDAPREPQRGAWGPDGAILFSIGRVYRVPDTGGVPQPVTDLDVSQGETHHTVMGFLSDGRRFIFGDRTHRGTFFVSLMDSARDRRVLAIGGLDDEIRDVSTTRGYLLYSKRGTIVAQPFDEARVELKGPPTTLADGAWSDPSASQNGVLVFRRSGYAVTQLTWRSRDGTLLGAVGEPDTYLLVELSPTNTRAAVVRAGPSPFEMDLKLADLTRGLVSNLTAYPGLESDPQWSPDERRLAFTSNRGGLWAPYMKDLVTGQEERLIEAKVNFAVDQWTHDGRYLIVRHMGHTMFALPTSGERKLQRLTEIRSGADQSQVSPDAEWIAFDSSIDGKPEVFVARFPALTDKKRISVAGGVQARWRHDSRELYYAAPDGNMMAVEVTRDRQMPFLAPRPLFKATFPEPGPDPEISQYDVSADGKRFLILEPKREPSDVFTFLLNWNQALKN